MAEDSSGTKTPTPGFVLPGLRCGVEMALVGTIVLLIGLPTEEPIRLGIVFLSALLAMTVILFWAVGRHMRRWIRYAQGKPTRTTPFD
ncbi:hypothetical protein [Haloarcula japonica]|uniref:Uncharacterized protein n=1 Tax=Haloarcula japonica (strain ATCC 49778 / DSM 6131 / JCM 7785 / NBRC 101032 / NCIMB 13157 / TR-1) TaxID=1227453 RepID=M0L7Y6_HALJT|nr:hypothetical protein [Haloarcula japonica]EMA29727.1 hypothetical protein C444_13047 [Haloarcula japonica DSM 6131]